MVSPYGNVKASFNQYQILLSPQLIYNFYNAENFKIYGGVGIVLSYSNYSNAAYVSKDANNSISGLAANDPFYFDSFDIPFMFKGGVQIHNNLEIFFNYLTSIATTKGGYYQLDNTRKQFGLYYFFGVK